MGESKPLVAVVVVTWNNENEVRDCLKSLQEQEYENYKIIVVDNDSADKSAEIIRQEFPEVTLLPQSKNTYFVGGHNTGIKYAQKHFSPKYLLIINPDTKASANLISAMVEVAEREEKIGIVSPKILFWEGKTIYSTGVEYDGFMMATQRGHLEKDQGQYDQELELNTTEGTCMLLHNKMLDEVGLFWGPLRMYSEDVELCIRAKQKGWRIFYTPEAIVWHKVLLSIRNNKQFKLERLKMRNWLLIALRHYKFKSKLAMLKKYLAFNINFFFKRHEV